MHVTFDIFGFEGSWKFTSYLPLYHFLKTCENSLSSLPLIPQVQTRPLKTLTEFCKAKVRKRRNIKILCAFYLPFSQRLRTFWALCDSHAQLCILGCHASSDRSHSKRSDIVFISFHFISFIPPILANTIDIVLILTMPREDAGIPHKK